MTSTARSTRRPSAATRRVAATQPSATPPAAPATPAVLNGVVQPTGTNTSATKTPRYAVVPAEGGGFTVAISGKPSAKVFKTQAQADAAMKLLIEMAPVRTSAAKPENVKQDAKRQLANLLVAAMGEAFAKLPTDSPILAALGKADAAQMASNWVHHLPVTADAFGTNLPLPKRSNWENGARR